jgi:hydrogenase maturation protease
MSPEKPDHRFSKTNRLTVIGVGNPDRGDDAAGLHVARALAVRLPHDVEVIDFRGNLNELMPVLADADHAILIDAAQSGAEPGTIRQFDAATKPLPAGHLYCSTHAFGVAEAIELSRALGRLPRKLIVFGIEGRDFTTGAALSDGVIQAIKKVSAMVVERIETWQVKAGE